MNKRIQKTVTNLWFDGRVEEALELYTSCLTDARVISITRYTEAGKENQYGRLANRFGTETFQA